MSEIMVRIRGVAALTGLSRTKIYNLKRQGLWTQPIKEGKRIALWPLSECYALNAARIRGDDKDKIRELVVFLEHERKAA